MKTDYSKKFQTHQHYHLKNGQEVVGVTTVLSLLNKPALVMWAYKLAQKNINYWEVMNKSKNIGTIAHYLIECKIGNERPDRSYLNDFSKNEVDGGYRSYNLFKSWLQDNKVSFQESELQMVSEKYKYGGTADIIAFVNGKRSLIDIKTGKNVFLEAYYQMSAYRQLYDENHTSKLQKVVILHIPHEGKSSYADTDISLKQLDSMFEAFTYLLEFRRMHIKFMEK